MANEFIARKGLIALADSQISGSLNLTGNITTTGVISGEFESTTGTAISGAFTSTSGSIAEDIAENSSSIASLNAASSSYLLNTTDTLTGDLTVTGILTAQEFHTEFISASIIYESGSTQFGDTDDDTHIFTGKVGIGVAPTNVPLDISSSTGSLLRLYNSDNTLYSEVILQSQDGSGYIWRAASGYNGSQGGANALNLYNVDGIVSIGTNNGPNTLNVSGSRLGIGTTSPSTRLDIGTTQGSGITMRYDTSTGYRALITPYWNSSTDTRMDFAINRVSGETPDVIMSVGYSSNVGIGTNTPGYKLDVQGTMLATGTTLLASSSDATVTIGTSRASQPSGSDTKLILSGKNLESGGTYYGDYGQILFNATSNYTGSARKWLISNGYATNKFAIIRGGDSQVTPTLGAGGGVTNGTVPFVISDDGRVGINNAGPDGQFDVSGGPAMTGAWNKTAVLTATYPVLVFNSDDTKWAGLAYDHSAAFRIYVNASSSDVTAVSPVFNILNNGNVGIGTTSPSQKVTIEVDASAYNALELRDSRGKASTPEAALSFRGRYSGAALSTMGLIVGAYDNSTDANTTSNMQFHINNGYSVVQAMKLQNDSSLAIANGAQSTDAISSQIIFGNRGYFSNPAVGGAKIVGVTGSPNWYSSTSLAFYTNGGPDVTSTGPTERMRITSGGQVNIGNNDSGALRFFNAAGTYVGGIGTNYWAFGASYASTDLGIIGPDNIYLGVNSGPVMRITSGGNVGIGETSPGKKLHVKDQMGSPNANFAHNDNVLAIFQNTNVAANAWAAIKLQSDEGSGLWFSDENGNNYHGYISCRYTGDMDFYTGADSTTYPTRKLRITTDGESRFEGGPAMTGGWTRTMFLKSQYPVIGMESNYNNKRGGIGFDGGGASGTGIFVLWTNAGTDNISAGTPVLYVSTSGVENYNGTYGTISSDQRLKENITDASSKLNDLLSLNVKNFNYIGDDKKHIGFIAQEFEQIFPSLVTTTDTREYDEEGNLISGLEDSKGLKVGMEFAILTKVIQEQQAIIEDLKTRIEALEG